MVRFFRNSTRSLSPAKLVEILADNGQEITLVKAALLLEMLYELANLSLEQELRRATAQQHRKIKKANKLP